MTTRHLVKTSRLPGFLIVEKRNYYEGDEGNPDTVGFGVLSRRYSWVGLFAWKVMRRNS